MRALEDDKYVRQTDGYLPKANVAFVDEIFKANSAILNTLLTVLNERLFDNGTSREQVPLLCLVGASHSVYHRKGLNLLLPLTLKYSILDLQAYVMVKPLSNMP